MNARRLSIVTTALVSVAGVVHAAAQDTGRIAGVVQIEGTDAAVIGAVIQVVSIAMVATTNAQGRYEMDSLPPGTYTLLVQAPGFRPKVVPATPVEAGVETQVRVALRPQSVALEPVTVEAEANTERLASSNVSVLRTEDLPPDGDLVSAIRGRLPGFDISYGGESPSPARTSEATVTSPTGRRVLWVLDGVPIRGNLGVRVEASEVVCLEVRRGARSTLEFLREVGSTGAYGAVIIVWTRGARRMTGACSVGN